MLAALLHIASHPGPADTLQLDAAHALGTLQDLKCMLRSFKGTYSSRLTEYPRSPDEFQQLDPAAYAVAYTDAKPVDCRVSELVLESWRACIPARKTHTSVGSPRTPLSRRAPREDDAEGLLTRLMMSMRCCLSVYTPHRCPNLGVGRLSFQFRATATWLPGKPSKVASRLLSRMCLGPRSCALNMPRRHAPHPD